jgi:transposase
MSWYHLLQSISESANDHLRLRNAYLAAENRILRRQIQGRVQLTDSERKELAEMGAKLGKRALAEIATVAQPDTILAWRRKFANQNVTPSKPPRSVGRPRVDQEIEAWVVRMARENRSWGYDRIQGSLEHLGYTISDQTVGNILKRHDIPPAPERKKTVTWREFIRCHLDVLLTTGFFTSEVWTGLRSALFMLLFFIPVGYRRHALWMTPDHHVWWMLSRFSQALKEKAQVPRWVGLIKMSLRSCLLSCRKGTAGLYLLPFIRHNRRPSLSQSMGQVVLIPMIIHQPIRAGPTRCHHHLDRQRTNNNRKAA